MPTTGAPTSAVVYLCPLETYRQWVPSTTPASGPLVPAGDRTGNGQYPVIAGPQLTYTAVSSYVSDRAQVVGWAGSNIPAVPYSYYKQPVVPSATSVIATSTSSQCIIPQTSLTTVGVPSPEQRHHDTVIQPLNPSQLVIDQSTDNPLVVSTNMGVVWHGEFDRLFSAFPHQWQLQPVAAADTQQLNTGEYAVFQDSAKVRFLCKNVCCGNAWTSMKGRVFFWIKAPQSHPHHHGIVHFKLFGQKCQKCKPDTFEHAMWYPQEAVKVVYNLYIRVGQLFYGFAPSDYYTQRRTGKPRQPHRSELCQACANNICREVSAKAAVSRSSSRATSSSAAESTNSSCDV